MSLWVVYIFLGAVLAYRVYDVFFGTIAKYLRNELKGTDFHLNAFDYTYAKARRENAARIGTCPCCGKPLSVHG